MRIHMATCERPILTGVASESAESSRVVRRVEVKESGEGEGSGDTTFLRVQKESAERSVVGARRERGSSRKRLPNSARTGSARQAKESRLTNWSTA